MQRCEGGAIVIGSPEGGAVAEVGGVHQVGVPYEVAALAGHVACVRLARPGSVPVGHVTIAAQGLVAIVAQYTAVVLGVYVATHPITAIGADPAVLVNIVVLEQGAVVIGTADHDIAAGPTALSESPEIGARDAEHAPGEGGAVVGALEHAAVGGHPDLATEVADVVDVGVQVVGLVAMAPFGRAGEGDATIGAHPALYPAHVDDIGIGRVHCQRQVVVVLATWFNTGIAVAQKIGVAHRGYATRPRPAALECPCAAAVLALVDAEEPCAAVDLATAQRVDGVGSGRAHGDLGALLLIGANGCGPTDTYLREGRPSIHTTPEFRSVAHLFHGIEGHRVAGLELELQPVTRLHLCEGAAAIGATIEPTVAAEEDGLRVRGVHNDVRQTMVQRLERRISNDGPGGSSVGALP